jgi:membrane associated rhomboid family serine protease
MILYLIIAVTVIVSLFAFNRRDWFDRLRFNAYAIKHNNQGWRFVTYAFIHADWIHLLINMFVLYSFGEVVYAYFQYLFGVKGILFFVLLYLGGIIFSVLVDFGIHKNNAYYSAVGASGAVSAIVFSSIILYPAGKIMFIFIPIPIPSAVFGILYLVYSAYMARKGRDNVGHNAHFWGAIFGIVFTIILKPQLFMAFIEQIKNMLN